MTSSNVQCFMNWAIHDDESRSIKSILFGNNYSEKFVMRHLFTKPAKQTQQSPARKRGFIRLPFKGNRLADMAHTQLSKAVKSTYNTMGVQLLFVGIPMIQHRLRQTSSSNHHNVHLSFHLFLESSTYVLLRKSCSKTVPNSTVFLDCNKATWFRSPISSTPIWSILNRW